MRVTSKDILRIRAGKSEVFDLESSRACNTARVLCQYVKNNDMMPEDVKGYATQTDYKKKRIIITALRKEV